jgi:dTDP-4-dehydrorhamnose reductase
MAGPRILLAGSGGQLGWELRQTRPASVELIAPAEGGFDITEPDQVQRLVDEHQPDWIINAAAYTAVDKAESESELAYAVNRDGAANLAAAAKRCGARLLQVSTDFVFDGQSSRPYRVDDRPNPIGVYGASKQAGDEAVLEQLGDRCAIIRTAWLYSAHGNNFVKTLLRLMAERDRLGIVADQVGSPTWARGLALALWRAVEVNLSGIHHWSDAGIASWYDFAVAIQEEAVALGLLNQACNIAPIRTEDYPTPAARPAYSVLDKTPTWQALDFEGTHWRGQLRAMLQQLEAMNK